MRTDDLIRALAHDRAARFPTPGEALALALVLGFAAAGALFLGLLGPRADFLPALQSGRFLLKFAVTLSLAASAAALALRFAYPAAHSRSLATALWIGPVLLGLGVLFELATVPSADWMARLVGKNAPVCLASIPTFAAPILLALFLALRRGAPTRPRLAGVAAGLAAGGLGAALYAAHCTDDSPLFVLAWYGPAIALVAGAGAWLGPRFLRW